MTGELLCSKVVADRQQGTEVERGPGIAIDNDIVRNRKLTMHGGLARDWHWPLRPLAHMMLSYLSAYLQSSAKKTLFMIRKRTK